MMELDDDVIEDENITSQIEFPSEVQNAIEQVLPSTDPLDHPDFNAVEYINMLFPTEQSLSNIDDVTRRMKMKIRQLDEEIRTVVRGQTSVSQDGRQALEDAQKAIQQLFARIKDIKDKAEKSEHMVKEITRDIKQLDHAKKHLTVSILTLNQLHMLVDGVEKLQVLVKKRQYGEIANLLQGVTNVIDHFQKYMGIPQIAKLAEKSQCIKAELTEQITSDFHNAFAGPNSKNFTANQQIAEACLVVSILEPKVKRELLKWIVSIQLSEYQHLFQETQDIAWLDKIDKRYNWLKNHLIEFEKKFGCMFPPDWEMCEHIAVEFCHITRKDLAKIMLSRKNEIDVNLLLFAIQKTTSFETLLVRRFSGVTLDSTVIHQISKQEGSNPFEDNDDTNPFKDDMKQEENLTPGKDATNNVSFVKVKNPFQGIISRCFEPHLNIYVEHQDRNLCQLMDEFVASIQKAELPKADVSQATVLPSCAELFVFYKKCLVQCSQLTIGHPLLALAATFQKYLREYANRVLQNSLPKVGGAVTSANLIQNFLKEGEGNRLFTPSEQVRVCSILTTADYCLETTLQLEGKLKEKVDPTLSKQINLVAEQDTFHNVISNCIQLLVQNLELACEPALITMTKIQWAAFEVVGDQSSYVSAITAHLRQTLPLLRDNLSTSRKYFTKFCMNFANSFIPKLISHLFKCKPISPIGAEQLLLDTHTLKTILLDLPSLGSVAMRKPPPMYIKIVVKGMTKAEMILKVVMAPHENVENFVDDFMKFLPESDISEFQKVLDMKGLKRSEVNSMTEIFRTRRPCVSSAGHPQEPDSGVPQTMSGSPEHESSRIRKLEKLIKRL